MSRRIGAFLGGVLVATSACGGSPDELPPFLNDNRYRPEPSGVAVDESSACQRLHGSITSRRRVLNCEGELRPCPDLIRAAIGRACDSYDEGTIEGCANYHLQADECAALTLDECVFAPLVGSCG